METKICSKCKQKKSVSEFSKFNKRSVERTKSGLRSACKECEALQGRRYRAANREKTRAYDIKRWKENKEIIKTRKAKYRAKNTEKERERFKQWRQKNPEKYKILYNRYRTKRLKTDPRFKLDHYFSRYIRGTLKNVNSSKANRNWETLVGYNAAQLKEHLEKQFKPEMNWDNHGIYWHIDHIKPKSWFKYDSAEHPEFKKCWALENLQPLEAKTNILKSNKYEG